MFRLAAPLAVLALSAHAHPRAEARCADGDPRACDEVAVDAAVKGDTETARAMLDRADALRAGAPPAVPLPLGKPELTAPPLIASDEPDAEPQLPRRRAPAPAARPTPEREQPAPEARAPSSPVGVLAAGGLDVAVPVTAGTVSLRPRVGLGLRFALSPRPDTGRRYAATPAAGFVVGYAGLGDSPRIFGEGRVELALNRAGGLFEPGFTLYALTGFDAHVRGSLAIDPYVGAGLGWNVNLSPETNGGTAKPRHSGWGGLGGGWGGGGGSGAIALIALPAIIAFVLAGRVEVRYHPVGVRGPASVDVLVGLGF